MNRALRLVVLLGTLSLATSNVALGESASIVSITTPRDAQQFFILIKPDHAIASVILFAGGSGRLRLNRTPPPLVGPYSFVAGNFLVRSREKFAAHDFMVAVIDAPSDQPKGMGPSFRVSKDQAIDIAAVADYLKTQAGVPVWLVGTSQGSTAAVNGAAHLGNKIAGVVLSSSVTRRTRSDETVFDSEPGLISVPALVVANQGDTCRGTPPGDAAPGPVVHAVVCVGDSVVEAVRHVADVAETVPLRR